MRSSAPQRSSSRADEPERERIGPCIKVQCPAKVDLFLDATGRRKDGRHNIAALFAKINLFDCLELEAIAPARVELSIDDRIGAGLDPGPENLVVRAAEAYRRAFGVPHGVRIRLEKKIPARAGRGGGPSDAAGTLLGMARLTGRKLDRGGMAALRKLAGGLGPYVPFFLREGSYAVGEGAGDKVSALDVSRALPPMVLVYPRVPVSAASVCRELGPAGKNAVLTALSQLGKLQKKLAAGRPISEWAGLLFNRLEDPVSRSYGQVRQAKGILERLGAQGALMSGTGSSVFGFFPGDGEAEKAAGRLRGYPWDVFVTCCLG